MLRYHLTLATVSLLPAAVTVVFHLTHLADLLASLLQEEDISEETKFDFIVVGGGSAGCVLANRLSEDGAYSVLLLEAGGTPSPLSSVPALTGYLQMSPQDWQFVTEPQEGASQALEGNRSRWPRGENIIFPFSLSIQPFL